MGVTIYDVSKLSGVSTATVSRTFSNPGSVRHDTRNKVYEAAKVLGYSPNAIARAMAKQHTDKVAFIICKEKATILDEFYAGICEGIMLKANMSDYQLLISTAEDWNMTESTAKNKQIEGAILGGFADADFVSSLLARDISVVLVNNQIAGFNLPCVVSDEYTGIKEAVKHLKEKGYKKIVFIAARISPYIIKERYNAFLKSMLEEGFNVNMDLIKMCNADIFSAVETATELLNRPDRPDAIIGANDMIAAGVMKAAVRLGLKIPDDVAVMGCDDSTICPMLEPELTSIHIDCKKMGEISMQILEDGLNGKEVPKVTIVPCSIHERNST